MFAGLNIDCPRESDGATSAKRSEAQSTCHQSSRSNDDAPFDESMSKEGRREEGRMKGEEASWSRHLLSRRRSTQNISRRSIAQSTVHRASATTITLDVERQGKKNIRRASASSEATARTQSASKLNESAASTSQSGVDFSGDEHGCSAHRSPIADTIDGG